MYAVHPQHNTMAATGWIKRGVKLEIPTTSGRERINRHGAMNAETLEVTIIESETVNDDSTIQLLEILENKYALAVTIFVILDNAKYHFSEKVQEFLKKSRIKLVFLSFVYICYKHVWLTPIRKSFKMFCQSKNGNMC
jgi:hypothetical protein